MERKLEQSHAEEAAKVYQVANDDTLLSKWGVSREQLDDAIAHVGHDIRHIEEYLVNKKWQGERDSTTVPFQKRDLNEDETY